MLSFLTRVGVSITLRGTDRRNDVYPPTLVHDWCSPRVPRMILRQYDPVVRQHVVFSETKIK